MIYSTAQTELCNQIYRWKLSHDLLTLKPF